MTALVTTWNAEPAEPAAAEAPSEPLFKPGPRPRKVVEAPPEPDDETGQPSAEPQYDAPAQPAAEQDTDGNRCRVVDLGDLYGLALVLPQFLGIAE